MRPGALGGALLAGLLFLGSPGCVLVHGFATAFTGPVSAASAGYDPVAFAERPDVSEPAEEERLLERFAPRFVIQEGSAPWNLIGTPTLHRRAGVSWARVDSEQPALFAAVREESVAGRALTQLVYRVHFDQLAPTWTGFPSLHRNAGLLVLVMLDRASEVPLLVATVHTCGCWLAVTPTEALARAALPADWPEQGRGAGGADLPAGLAVPRPGERLVVHLATRTHRVHDLTLEQVAPPASRALPLRPMDELYCLPIQGAKGETGSFFHEAGYLRGYVKGAWAPIEGLTLGLLTLDPRLGMDRDFGAPEETGARFFTALAPWKREASRLDRLERALRELGFRVDAFGPAEEPADGAQGAGGGAPSAALRSVARRAEP